MFFMQTKKKKEFNKIVKSINEQLKNTDCFLLEYNDKHIREKIEEKFSNPHVTSSEIMAYYIKPADICECKADLDDEDIDFAEAVLDNYPLAKFYIDKIDDKTFHTESFGVGNRTNIKSPRGERKDGGLSATTKFVTLMLSFYIDRVKQTRK